MGVHIETDYIYDGNEASGDVASMLLDYNMDVGALRPYKQETKRGQLTGRTALTLNLGYARKKIQDAKGKTRIVRAPKYREVVVNAASTLRKDEWILFDSTIVRVQRPLLKFWNDIKASSTFNVPDGMGVTVIQHQSMTDFGNATISMDGLRRAERDRPTFDLVNFPLPLIHADFSFSAREIAVSRRQGIPLDTTAIEQNTRKIAEELEKLALGTLGTYSYGGGTIYGVSNYPDRLITTLTAPTTPGWVPMDTYNEILDMIQDLQDIYFNGPYRMYYSPAWTKYLNMHFSEADSSFGTVMSQLRNIPDITDMRKLDFLTGFQIILIQMTPDVIRAVQGMSLRTIQWDSHGTMQKNFKIIGLMVPQLRSNGSDQTGINHGTGV